MSNWTPEHAAFTAENTPLKQQGPGILVEYQPDSNKDEVGNLQAVTAALLFTADRILGNLPQVVYPDFSAAERAVGLDTSEVSLKHDSDVLRLGHRLADGVMYPSDQTYSLDGLGSPVRGKTVFGHNAYSEYFLGRTMLGEHRWYRTRAQLVRTAANAVLFGVTTSDGDQVMNNVPHLRSLFSGTTLSEQTGTAIDLSIPEQPETIPTFRFRSTEPHPSIVPLGRFSERTSELAREHGLQAASFRTEGIAWSATMLVDPETQIGLLAVLEARGCYDYTEGADNPRTTFKEKDGDFTLVDADTGQPVRSESTQFHLQPFITLNGNIAEFDPRTDFAPGDIVGALSHIVKDLHGVLVNPNI